MEVRSIESFFPYPLNGFYDGSGSVAMPAARAVAADGSYGLLPGAHPVLAHAICTGDADVQALRVMQSVRRADATIAGGTVEIAQRFRVPEGVELHWLELPVKDAPGVVQQGGGTSMPSGFATVGIVDGAVLGEPTMSMPPTLIEAPFSQSFYYEPGPRWAANNDFDHTIMLAARITTTGCTCAARNPSSGMRARSRVGRARCSPRASDRSTYVRSWAGRGRRSRTRRSTSPSSACPCRPWVSARRHHRVTGYVCASHPIPRSRQPK